MATPVGHAIAGYAVSGFARSAYTGNRISLILLCAFVGVLPDLDVIPGIVRGTPALYHQGITHSLGFALATSGIIAGAYKIRGKSFSAIFVLCFAAYSSHLILDIIGPDGRLPFGVPLFWPLSNMTFISPVPVLLGAQHAAATSTPTSEWIQALFSLRNFVAITIEILISVPFLLLGHIIRRGSVFRRSGELSKRKS